MDGSIFEVHDFGIIIHIKVIALVCSHLGRHSFWRLVTNVRKIFRLAIKLVVALCTPHALLEL